MSTEPTPTLRGFDAQDADGVAANIADIAVSGMKAIGLYYFAHSGVKTLLTRSVAETVAAHGLSLWSVYENGQPVDAPYFTVQTANLDAHTANARAVAAGQPADTPLYCAVDYDTDPSDLPAITAYFTEFRRVLGVLGSGYHAGVYGSGLVCRHLSELGLISHTWLSQSTGFAEFDSWKPHANIVQGVERNIFGLDVDLDTLTTNAGTWVPVSAE